MDSMTLKLGQVQLMVGRDKAENLRRACALIRRAAEQGAQLVMLPEMFCCPYENEMFRPNSEEQGGPAQQALSALSRELGIWIVGGTVPTLLYYGLKLCSPSIIVPLTFVLCAITSLFTGSSFGSIATMGLALFGVRGYLTRLTRSWYLI